MTKGQRAMAVAMIYPDSEQGKRETSFETKEVGVSAGRISLARTVLKWLPKEAPSVLITGRMARPVINQHWQISAFPKINPPAGNSLPRSTKT